MSSEIQNLKQRGDIKGIVDVLNDANQRIHLRSIEVSQGRFDDVNGYDDYVFVRLEAVRALEEIGDDDAFRALQQILEIKRTLGYESLKTDVAKAIKAIQHRKPEVPAKGDMTVKQLYITKEQQKYGPYSVDEVRQYIADKHFTTSDWAWHEGLTDWVPIHSIPGVVTQNAPPLLPVQSPNDGKAQPLLAKDNKGTRFRDKSHADSHWNARYLTRFTPVVIYNFPTLEAARKAITSLSFIREASDTGELVATEVVEFGCFLRGDQGEVSICGDMFTREMWRERQTYRSRCQSVL